MWHIKNPLPPLPHQQQISLKSPADRISCPLVHICLLRTRCVQRVSPVFIALGHTLEWCKCISVSKRVH